MAIYQSYYDTTIGQSGVPLIKDASHQILTAAIRSPLKYDPKTGACYIAGPEYAAVPAFFHPIIVQQGEAHHQRSVVVLDARNYVQIDRTGEVTVRNPDEFNFQCVRTALTQAWVNDPHVHLGMGPEAMRKIAGVSLAVYAQLISEMLGTKLALELDTQHRLYILAGIFYNSLFLTESPNELVTERLAISLAADLRADIRLVKEMLAMTNYIVGIPDFINFAKEIDPIRLHSLSKATLTAVMSGVWYGTDANFAMVSALEHPPTFIAMLYAGGVSRGYKNTRLMKLLDRSATSKEYPSFAVRVARLIQQIANEDALPSPY